MQLVATLNGVFFRAISVTQEDSNTVRETMLQDQEGLEFELMTSEEFEILSESF